MLFPVPSRKRAIFLRLLRWRILLRSVHIFDRPNVRRVFRKHAGKWIPVLWGSGLAMLAIALALESLHLPIWPAIVLSYILFAAAMCWSVGYWLTSDMILRLNPRTWNRVRRRRITRNSWINYRLAKWCVAILITTVFAIAIWATFTTDYLIELHRPSGVLIPASDPTPRNPCGTMTNGDVVILYGDNAAIAHKFPHVLLRSITMGDVISLDRLPDGSIAVLMDIKDSDGKIVVRMDRKGFVVNQNRILEMHRSDRSTLTVTDEDGIETLNIRYLNAGAISIAGAFRYPGQRRATPFTMAGAFNICTTGADNGADFGMM